MKRVAGRQTRFINKLAKRTGSLWEGRFKSSIISRKEYLLSCSHYIELNPVLAGMVEEPSGYTWSSFAKKVEGKPDSVVHYDFRYKALGENAAERQRAYNEFVCQTDKSLCFLTRPYLKNGASN